MEKCRIRWKEFFAESIFVAIFIYPMPSEDQLYFSLLGTIFSYPIKRVWIERMAIKKKLTIDSLKEDLFFSNNPNDFLKYYQFFNLLALFFIIGYWVMSQFNLTEKGNVERVLFGINVLSLSLNCMIS